MLPLLPPCARLCWHLTIDARVLQRCVYFFGRFWHFFKKMSWEKESLCIEDFINIYRSEHCLWKIKSKEYHDKFKRDAAYILLIEKLKEIDTSATKSVVVKKINNLRSSYQKELKKVKESTRTGLGADDVYQPKLWYLNMLSFLDDQDIPRNSRSNIESDDEKSVSEVS